HATSVRSGGRGGWDRKYPNLDLPLGCSFQTMIVGPELFAFYRDRPASLPRFPLPFQLPVDLFLRANVARLSREAIEELVKRVGPSYPSFRHQDDDLCRTLL